MTMLEVFDPPMCCATGVCGPRVDPVLVRFAADLEWLRQQGVSVRRFNAAQEPQALAGRAVVAEALAQDPAHALPIILCDGQVVSQRVYPARAQLAAWAGLAAGGGEPSCGPTCCGSPGCG